jgi:quinol monooxygenase YgiN
MATPEPFVFIGTHRLKQGRRDDWEEHVRDFVRFIEENEPQLRLFTFYLDEDTGLVSVVQVHPDAESMTTHMQVARRHIGEAYQDLIEETTSIQIFGEPDEAVLSMMRNLAGAGVPISIAGPVAGFHRLPQPSATA